MQLAAFVCVICAICGRIITQEYSIETPKSPADLADNRRQTPKQQNSLNLKQPVFLCEIIQPCCIPLRYLRYLRENIHVRVLNQSPQNIRLPFEQVRLPSTYFKLTRPQTSSTRHALNNNSFNLMKQTKVQQLFYIYSIPNMILFSHTKRELAITYFGRIFILLISTISAFARYLINAFFPCLGCK